MQSPGIEDKVLHTTFRIGDTTVMASDGRCTGAAEFKGFSLSLAPPDEAEAKRLFAALADGGQVQMPLTKTFWSPVLRYGHGPFRRVVDDQRVNLRSDCNAIHDADDPQRLRERGAWHDTLGRGRGMAFGPRAGLERVDLLTSNSSLTSYHLLPSVRGDFLAKLGRLAEARAEFERRGVTHAEHS